MGFAFSRGRRSTLLQLLSQNGVCRALRTEKQGFIAPPRKKRQYVADARMKRRRKPRLVVSQLYSKGDVII